MANQENVCDVDSLSEPYRTLISAAILAPSGDNTQPWRFEIDEETPSITVCVDETRDTSPMNAGQRMARIACGAAVENMVQTAVWNRWRTTVENVDSFSVRIGLDGDRRSSGEIPEVIKNRHTNRKRYYGQPISASHLRVLKESIDVPEGIAVRFITARPDIERVMKFIGKSDEIMFGQPRFLRAFLDNVRFDQPSISSVDFGLSVGSLELSWLERKLLPHMKRLPEAVFRSFPMRRAFKNKAEQLVKSAGGLCVIFAYGDAEHAALEVGRVMERAWLTLTESGLSVQPMMSLPVLLCDAYFENTHGNKTMIYEDGFLSAASETVFQHGIDGSHATAILRFGNSLVETNSTGRMKTVTVSSSLASRSKAYTVR